MAAMKRTAVTAALVLALLPGSGRAVRAVRARASPVTQIVTLLTELKGKLEADGQAEQRSYDKYACWCEDSLASKAGEITSAKDEIEALQTRIAQLNGEIASHSTDIKQLKKDILSNRESQREATEMRNKEALAYEEDKAEFEQCLGALEAAIKVLAGAGAGKAKFLETLQEAQLLSAVAGVRGLLHRASFAGAVGQKDLQVVQHFVERPEDFVGGRAGALSAAQIASNPFGDYAPQSTQIQGILKGMYDSFTGDLEKANVEEAQKQKGFQELMATKRSELATLEGTLLKQTADEADKSKSLADSKTAKDDTQAQLEADEALFSQTKDSCEEKARELAQRTRLRSEELQGFHQAIAILSSPEAAETFKNASATFLQLSAGAHAEGSSGSKAYQHLRSLAMHYRSVEIARLATQVHESSDGHFDQVIAAIDNMIALLRKEEQQDIADRDWCERKAGKNKNSIEDINYDIDKAKQTVGRLTTEAGDLQKKIGALEGDMNATKDQIAQLVQMRTQESADFIEAVKDDTVAVALLGQAIVMLEKFYRRNGIALALSQGGVAAQLGAAGALAAAPAAAPPAAPWESGAYAGRQGESGGILAILKLVQEDYEKEIETARQNDGAAQVNFEKDKQALQDTLDAYATSKAAAGKELADLNAKIADLEKLKTEKGQDLSEEKKVETDLQTDCAWVASHFQTRRDKRKTEIDGLIDAKNFLAGTDDFAM